MWQALFYKLDSCEQNKALSSWSYNRQSKKQPSKHNLIAGSCKCHQENIIRIRVESKGGEQWSMKISLRIEQLNQELNDIKTTSNVIIWGGAGGEVFM